MIGSILITLVMAAAPADRVLASWDFVNGLQGWSTNGTTKVGHASGAMVVETDGRDPIVLSPPVSFVPEDGDLLEVRMSATRDGDIQWFYRTTTEGQYGGFRPDAQRLVPVGGGEKVQTYGAAMLWGGDKPIIGLRLDLPEGGPGTTPMQNMEPTLRPNNPMIVGHNPDLYRQMLTAAKETIAEHGLRPWISCEAFNEWLEGSYLEPSTQWGFSYLEAIRDTLGRAEK